MENDNKERNLESIYSKRLRAGKRRTYFFDVRATKGNDYYLTITESRKRFDDNGYDRHKVFLYKEDFNKFIKALTEAVDFVKTDLMPDFDFDAFNHDDYEEGRHKPYASSDTANKTTDISSEVPKESAAESTEPVNSVSENTEANDAPDTNSNETGDSPSTEHEEVDKW